MIIPPGTAMGTSVTPNVPEKPMAETVSLEVVWAAAFAAAYVREELNTHGAVKIANEAVGDLLTAHPRGGK